MSCCPEPPSTACDDPCGSSNNREHISGKILCPCQKCREKRGEQTYEIAARAANHARTFAKAGGNCFGKLMQMMPSGGNDGNCDSSPCNDCDDTPQCPEDKSDSFDCDCCDDDEPPCDQESATCLCSATPNCAQSISCCLCECLATIGFFVIAIVVFWVSAGYHLGQLFWKSYKTPAKCSKRLQNPSNDCSKGASAVSAMRKSIMGCLSK